MFLVHLGFPGLQNCIVLDAVRHFGDDGQEIEIVASTRETCEVRENPLCEMKSADPSRVQSVEEVQESHDFPPRSPSTAVKDFDVVIEKAKVQAERTDGLGLLRNKVW